MMPYFRRSSCILIISIFSLLISSFLSIPFRLKPTPSAAGPCGREDMYLFCVGIRLVVFANIADYNIKTPFGQFFLLAFVNTK